MSKTILVTGATDGIGKLTASLLAAQGHNVLLHGRNSAKLQNVAADIHGNTESYIADLSKLSDVESMAAEILERHTRLDVLINNAGILKTSAPRTADDLDIRYVVNTFAPYVLTQRLLPIIPASGRIINLSSAAQAPIDFAGMKGERHLEDMDAYAQSKLAITIWSQEMARELQDGPIVVAVNPGSLLASKMVKEGFGVAGSDLRIGADILCKAALDDSFAQASGKYFDNDSGAFQRPHFAAQKTEHTTAVMQTMKEVIARMQG